MRPPEQPRSTEGADLPTGETRAATFGEGDGSLGQFLANLLAAECLLGPAEAAVVLKQNGESGIALLAARPHLAGDDTLPPWVQKAGQLARNGWAQDQTLVEAWLEPSDLYGQPARSHILLVPLKLTEMPSLAAAFLLRARGPDGLQAIRERIELSISVLNLSESRQTLRKKELDLQQLRKSLEVLSQVNRHPRFGSAAMALCNETAAQWQAERVSLGFLKGRYVRVKAISHTEDFSRKMQIVQDIESAMEECLDQDCEVICPASPDATYVSRATAELSRRHGPLALVSLPIRQDGEARAVLTLERPVDRPFSVEDIEALRLSLELCTPRLLALRESDRWVGAKFAGCVRRVLAALVGPTHTWAKIAAIAILGVVLFLVFAKGNYRVEASFLLEGTERQIVPAPFDGYIKAVEVEVGDTITAGETSLAQLDTVELRLRLAEAKSEKAGYLKQMAAAMRDGETSQAQIAQANADKVQAQIDLLDHMIEQARIISPLSGTLVEGDLKRRIGAPVKTGDVLFEVTPLDSLRATLHVAEDQVVDVKVGQEGRLATASYPAERIRFEVERINPMAEVVKQKNVFKVRVRLLDVHPWMRPGMEGVAKIDIDKRPYAWIWTRKIVNWVRMKLWW